MRPDQVIVEQQSRIAVVFSRWLAEQLERALHERGRAALALTGGSVAEILLPHIKDIELDWSRLHWYWGDERAVPPDSPESNFALAKRLLLNHAPIPPANVHRMPADDFPLATAASRYAATLTDQLGNPPRLDVVLLGIGPDGHVCSLFPGHPALESTHWVTSLEDSPKPPASRVTLSVTCLAQARALALAAFGSSKAAIVRELLTTTTTELPAARVLCNAARQEAQRSLLFLDPAAASEAPPASLGS